jgi:hypothetical protein
MVDVPEQFHASLLLVQDVSYTASGPQSSVGRPYLDRATLGLEKEVLTSPTI